MIPVNCHMISRRGGTGRWILVEDPVFSGNKKRLQVSGVSSDFLKPETSRRSRKAGKPKKGIIFRLPSIAEHLRFARRETDQEGGASLGRRDKR